MSFCRKSCPIRLLLNLCVIYLEHRDALPKAVCQDLRKTAI